jgi:hypothetical protein
MPIRTAMLAVSMLLLTAATADAQLPPPQLPPPPPPQPTQWSDRGYLNANLAFQLTARPFDELVTPVIYGERASVGASHPIEGRRLTLDVAGGIRLLGNLGVGGAMTKFAVEETSAVVARVPHPTLFNQPRLASKDTPFKRTESAIHVHAVYLIPVTSRLDVMVSAGPSFITVQQDFVQRIEVAEAGPPFATVAIGNVAISTQEVRKIGIHGGADVTWFVTPILGFGVSARYVRGASAMQLSDGSPLDVNVGGFQIGWGARVRIR